MPAKLSAFLIWLLVAAGLVFWGYRLLARPQAAPANVQTVSESGALRGDLSRLLGAAPVQVAFAPAPVAESSRFRLLGVLAPVAAVDPAKKSGAGVALIGVDGKPARAYVVGARLDGDLVLQSVARRSASIGPSGGPASLVLELPPPTAPTTGILPRAVADGEPARAMAPAGQAMQGQPPAMAQAQPVPPRPGDAAIEDSDEDEEVTPPKRAGGVNPTTR